MTGWLHETMKVTVVLLVASLLLVAAGSLGIGAGLPLVAILLGLALGAGAVRDSLAAVRSRLGIPLGRYLAVAWAGPLVAAGVTIVGLGATAGEVQALGGLVGLVGMLNYFLRPVYYVVYATARRVAGAV